METTDVCPKGFEVFWKKLKLPTVMSLWLNIVVGWTNGYEFFSFWSEKCIEAID